MSYEYVTLKENDLKEFIVENFRENSIVELSYNRVFLPGKLLHVEDNVMLLQLRGQLLNQTVEINIDEIKEELVEIRYTNHNKTLIITITD